MEAKEHHPYVREVIKCSKPGCESEDMIIQNLQEMYWHPKKHLQPLFGPTTKVRIVCAHCNTQMWPIPKPVEVKAIEETPFDPLKTELPKRVRAKK